MAQSSQGNEPPQNPGRFIETKFASLGVTQDVRAQIQSHGLGGIQNKHYNKYLYMAEKMQVLTMWEEYLASLLA